MYENVQSERQKERAKVAKAKVKIFGTTFHRSPGHHTILASDRRSGMIGDPKAKGKVAKAKDSHSECSQKFSWCIRRLGMCQMEVHGKMNGIKEDGKMEAAAVDYGLGKLRKW